ncbi:hypothetical protein PybrP1_012570 [[Pythium] brassicae (nom. inval.)]|nr:hypothetical protein PybrP1_012570 [[Pythium] brassicae (nom. inval.)]
MAAQNLAVILIQKRVRGMLCRLRARRRQPLLRRTSSISALLHTRSPMQRFVASGRGSFGDERGFHSFTAMRVQAWFRMQRLRWAYTLERFPVYHIAALQIQYAWKAHCQRGLVGRAAAAAAGPPPRIRAALRLQAAWRSYTNKRIYRYYRDLIAFQDAGDPAMMLRAINPGEASLLDASMGALVRFRLGGVAFPPTIYYKIFTRRAVCDLNAFSPKNYALAQCQAAPSRHRHQHRPSRLGPEPAQSVFIRVGHSFHRAKMALQDTRSWYQRLEHNGWRPVTAKVVSEASADPVARATAAKPALVPTLVRRQDAGKLRRAKKRAWMRKLYAQGLLKEVAGSSECHALRRVRELNDDDDNDSDSCSGGSGRLGGAIDPAAIFDVDFENEHWEAQAEDMFQWASALDFDEYVASWRSLGKSASSDDDPALA